jgi:hypothetical protein
MKCNQSDCDSPPVFRFTWPGKDEARICAIHAVKLRGVANAMGLYVQLIQLTPEDYITPAGDQSIMSTEDQR